MGAIETRLIKINFAKNILCDITGDPNSRNANKDQFAMTINKNAK